MSEKIYILLLFLMLSITATAQINKNKEVRVVSKYKSVMENADKIKKKAVLSDTIKSNIKFIYNLNPTPEYSKMNFIEGYVPDINIRSERNTNGGFLRLAGGNYSTLLGEFAYDKNKTGKYNWGIYLKNISREGTVNVAGRGDKESKNRRSNAGLYYTKYIDNSIFRLSFDYAYDKLKYYGYSHNPHGDTLNQSFDNFSFNASYESKYSAKSSYKALITFNDFRDKFSGWRENNIGLALLLKTKLLGNQLQSKFKVNQYSFNQANDYLIFSAKPKYTIFSGRFLFDIGAGITAKSGDNKKVYIYPQTSIRYEVVKDILSIYAEAGGGANTNVLKEVAAENQFALVIAETLPNITDIKSANVLTFTQYALKAGLRGMLSSAVSFNVGGKYESINNYRFFTNYRDGEYNVFSSDKYFHPIYDDVKLMTLYAELSADIDNKVNLYTKFNYYNYDLDQLKYAFHKPDADINFSIAYKYSDNLTAGIDILYAGQRKYEYINLSAEREYRELSSFTNINIKTEYKFSRYIQTYLKVNNIFNSKYEMWSGYPCYGTNILLGASFCF